MTTNPIGKKIRGNYDVVRTVAFAMVLIQHFLVTCTRNDINIPSWASWIIEGGAVNFGIVGVGLFFLLSGSLLWRNNKETPAKIFYRKNLVKLFLPVWVSYILFAIAYYAKNGILWDVSPLQVVVPMLGGNFFAPVIQKHARFTTLNLEGEWFTTVIILLYLLFPLLRKIFKSKFRHLFSVIVISLFIGNFHFDFLIYQGGHISLTLGLLYFWVGMYFEEYRKFISRPGMSLISVLGAVALWTVNTASYLGNVYMPNVPIILLLYLSSFSVSKTAGWMRWVAKYSYIFYLIHHTFMNWLIPVMGVEDMGIIRTCLMFVVLVLLIVAVGIFEMEICKIITDFCTEAMYKWKKRNDYTKLISQKE